MSEVFAASIPPVSQKFFDAMVKAHRPVRAQPNVTTMDELMYDAGKQDLIEWIKQHVQSSTVTASLNRHAE